MVFTVGYPHDQAMAASFSGLVANYPQIAEVYFAVPGRPSGRYELEADHGAFVRNLAGIRAAGKKLNMLLNSACDGVDALTDSLLERIKRDFHTLARYGCRPDSVTVTSFRTARFMKEFAPDVKVRISVINRTRSVAAMQYFGDAADGFYVDQDMNRNMDGLWRIREWCTEKGKELCLLANSACIADCPFRTEHYNIVSHMKGIARSLEAEGSSLAERILDTVPCQAVRAARPLEFALRGTWIPPKNVQAYDGVCDMMKLSCRMHPDPKRIFDAYCLGADCDILDVLGERLVPTDGVRLIQSELPDGMFEKFLTCRARGCDRCGYCSGLAGMLGREK